MMLEQIQLLARYNQLMNQRIYDTAAQLSAAELEIDRGAFFRSITGTLNHIYVADIIWLQRFSTHSANYLALHPVTQLERPRSLQTILYADFDELSSARTSLDQTILTWTAEISVSDLDYLLSYHNMKGETGTKKFASLILHFFNHQTHHRGQVTTLLSQVGLDVGVTDLLELI
ncbi:MAG: hypothetical protein RLZZ499_469 [Cyanobacteriota bacterium]